MTDPVPDGPAPDQLASKPATLNAGQSLVALYRAARLSQRPSLQTELRNDRLSLRAQRAATLARKQAVPAASQAADAKSLEGAHVASRKDGNFSGGPSMFAQFIDHAEEQKTVAPPVQETIAAPHPDPAACVVEPAPACAIEPAPELPAPNVAEPLAAEPVIATPEARLEDISPARPIARGPALAAIGFGPGMVIRFGQLGIETASDLAAADEAGLRAALGDISRLVNVDVWIESARRACAGAD